MQDCIALPPGLRSPVPTATNVYIWASIDNVRTIDDTKAELEVRLAVTLYWEDPAFSSYSEVSTWLDNFWKPRCTLKELVLKPEELTSYAVRFAGYSSPYRTVMQYNMRESTPALTSCNMVATWYLA